MDETVVVCVMTAQNRLEHFEHFRRVFVKLLDMSDPKIFSIYKRFTNREKVSIYWKFATTKSLPTSTSLANMSSSNIFWSMKINQYFPRPNEIKADIQKLTFTTYFSKMTALE